MGEPSSKLDLPGVFPPAPLPPPVEVEPALALFERGDFRGARAALKILLSGSPSQEAGEAARGLLARTEPDRWVLGVGLLAFALLAVLVAVYLW